MKMSDNHCTGPAIPCLPAPAVPVRHRFANSDRLLKQVIVNNHLLSKMIPNQANHILHKLYTEMRFVTTYGQFIPDGPFSGLRQSFDFDAMLNEYFTPGPNGFLSAVDLADANRVANTMAWRHDKAHDVADDIRFQFKRLVNDLFRHMERSNLVGQQQREYDRLKSFIDAFKASPLMASNSGKCSPSSTTEPGQAPTEQVLQQGAEDVEEED